MAEPKKEAYRAYLESAGVIESLTKGTAGCAPVVVVQSAGHTDEWKVLLQSWSIFLRSPTNRPMQSSEAFAQALLIQIASAM